MNAAADAVSWARRPRNGDQCQPQRFRRPLADRQESGEFTIPYNNAGVFQRVMNWQSDATNSIPMTPSRFDQDANDMASGLSQCVTRNGQSPATANLPMGGFKLTGLAAGTSAGDSVSYDQLTGTTGASNIGFIQPFVGAQLRTVQDVLRDSISIFSAMTSAQIADVRAGTHAVDVTSVMQTVIDYCAPMGIPIFLPAGTYNLVPATAQSGAASYNTALVMRSGMRLIGERGTILRVCDNYSTDASPKELAIFSTVANISNVSFSGITFDLNGANNKMSPSRPTTYNQFNHAAILVNGPTGIMSDVEIDNCIFQNTAGVCFIVAALVAVGSSPALGQRWKITRNFFHNGGLDTNDHTSIYAWAEDVVCEGNTFWEDSPPHTVGKTGGATCYEIHGSNQRFVNNYCYQYSLGIYVAPNFTSKTYNSIIQGNTFYCSDFAILLWRAVALGYQEIDGVLISGNTAFFDNYTYSGQSLYKSFVAYQGQIATAQGVINNVKISDNLAYNSGATLLSQFVRWDTSTTASNTGSNLSVTDNQVQGFTDGFYLVTNAANGIGNVEVSRNQFINNTPDSLSNPPHGIFVQGTAGGAVKTLIIENNSFIDERGSPSFANGIYFTGVPITDLALGPQVFKGLTSAVLTVSSATITNRIGTGLVFEGITSSNVSDGGSITFTPLSIAGILPKYVNVNGTNPGDTVNWTTYTTSTIVANIKKYNGGTLTAGSPQICSYRAVF